VPRRLARLVRTREPLELVGPDNVICHSHESKGTRLGSVSRNDPLTGLPDRGAGGRESVLSVS
jgi:hypothetical protein